jgi:alpha-L-fucosidase
VRFGDGRDWFFAKRFGLFIHWGLYAIPAWHEQVQWRRGVPRREYERLAHQFRPTRFSPDAWLDVAERAGMEYLCFTVKHHDGFCLWGTRQTDFHVLRTPYGRDVLRELAEACHRRGFPLCLYYSCVDWHHPNYPNAGRHHELPGPEPGDEPDLGRYLEFVRAQVRELCTEYGEIHGFWWDMNVPGHRDPSLNALIRSLQPKAVINNRGYDEGDFETPERQVPPGRKFSRPTEANQSVGRESWGYRADEDYYTPKFLMQSVDRVLAMGGNYLLNVGPRADGTLPPEAVAILARIGDWYRRVREAFADAEPVSDWTTNEDVLLTRRGNCLYVHLHRDPESADVVLRPLPWRPLRATLLNTGQPVPTDVVLLPRFWREGAYLRLRGIGALAPQDEVPVVKLEFDILPAAPV